jgi:outer membrane protein assembly factor BamB
VQKTSSAPSFDVRFLAVAVALGACQAAAAASAPPAARPADGAQALEDRFVLGPAAADDLGFRINWQTGALATTGAQAQKMSVSADSVWFGDSVGSVVRLRRDNGETVWRASTNPGIERITGFEHLPAGKRDEVFVVTDLNSVALDAGTGMMVRKSTFAHLPSRDPEVFGSSMVYGSSTGLCCWFQYGTGFNWRASSLGGNIVAPVTIAGHIVLVGSTSGAVYALDAATAEILWTRRLTAGVEAKIAADDRACFIAGIDQSVWAFDLSNGRVLWQHFTSSPLRNPPSRIGDGLYVQIPGEGLVSFNPAPRDKPDGEVRWRSNAAGDVVSVSGNRLYAWEARSRTMSVVDAASGRVIHESRIPNAVQLQFTAPVDGDMLLMGADGRVESLAPSRRPAPAAPAAPATSAVEASASASAAPSR